jgi:hypothetical protein
VADHVQAEDDIRLWIVEGAFRKHPFGATDLAPWEIFLGGLEQECDGTTQVPADTSKHLRCGHPDGGVAIMTAGVHHRNLDAIPERARARRRGSTSSATGNASMSARSDYGRTATTAQGGDDAGDGDIFRTS